MLELIAQGPNLDSRWRRPLPFSSVEIGRGTTTFRVPWDGKVSRRHVRLHVDESGVRVEKIQDASNPVFFNGKEKEEFTLSPGEHFVIGSTTITLADARAFASLDAPDPISQRSFSPEFLKKVVYRNADRRVDILNRLPDAISSAGNTDDLLIRIINLLISGIPTATSAGVVQIAGAELEGPELAGPELGQSESDIEVIHWDQRGFDGGDFQPSGTLIRQAIATSESVLHVWSQGSRQSAEYTVDYENDWAFVTPIQSVASPGWGLYVAGKNRSGSSSAGSQVDEPDLQGDIKFTELIGATLKNLLLVKQFERQNSTLSTFFSPVVLHAIAGQDPEEVLRPRACDVSVLFCDLRGFSKTSEEMSDQLFELLARVSESLSIVTNEILGNGGVVGDFHGDSAMGFWGWPLEPGNKRESAVGAIQSALQIQKTFRENLASGSKLANFQVGIGIASGEVVAGKIGSRDQVKVTAFGPVVNLASRLEGMTRLVNSEILIDSATAKHLIKSDLKNKPQIRRFGNFLPAGLKSVVNVFQVFENGTLDVETIVGFEQALVDFENGNWEQALPKLRELADSLDREDPAILFLQDFMTENAEKPPKDWNGVIALKVK
jgi:adenylate cyclase